MDLKQFCCKDPMHPNIAEPFTQGGKTWATNGFLAIGVTPIFGVRKQDTPKMAELISKAGEPGEWYKVPAVEVQTCKHCAGVVNNCKCYECGGVGTVTLSNTYTEYSGIECGSCEGEGEVLMCRYCSGTGVDADELVTIGPAQFKANALHLLRDLPNVEISPTGAETSAHLRFDGGIGFLMPGKDTKKNRAL